jgi:hypothetical protein
MAEPTSDDLDKALRDSGFKKDPNDDYHYRINENGQVERRWTDGDYSQSSDNNYNWQKHQNGDQY